MANETNPVQRFAELIKGIKFTMLTTTSSDDGTLRSRPMTLQEGEFDGDLWFFTARSAPVSQDILENGRVNLAFSDVHENSYVSASGMAELIDDRKKAEELWQPLYKAWFPEGLEDPELCLIKVHVESVDYWDSPSSPVVQLAGFAKAIATGERAKPGEREHINLN